MCTQAQLQIILQTIHAQAVAEFGEKLDAVILFGSYARGDYDAESDIDVMIRVGLPKTELHQYLDSFVHLTGTLGMAHDVFISFHLQDLETFNCFKEILPFYRNVVKDGVQIGA